MLQQKTENNIIQIGHKFLIIHKDLIIGGSRSEKTHSLYNLINEELDIDKIYLYAKDPYEAKYKF